MPLTKNYQPTEVEPPIDTPPATVSGHLHLGHVCSYSHGDFIARFMRMTAKQVFYPMGFDDNGLPTEKLVEKSLGSELTLLQLGVANSGLAQRLAEATSDLMSITRARRVEIVETLNSEMIPLPLERADISIGIK